MNNMKEMFATALYLLLLSHTAHSFVLLTANIEDIKKLARKFVSESLTEKIADFIAKATEQMVANVSEENDRNENRFQDISKENNKLYTEAKYRNEKQEPKNRYQKKVQRKPVKKVFKTAKIDDRQKRDGRVNLKNIKKVQNVSKNREPEKSYKYPKQYSLDSPKVNMHRLSTEIPQLDSTIGIAEKMQPEKEVPKNEDSKSKFLNPNRFRLTANSKENEMLKPNDFDNFQKVLTTRKERNEFDQYDNLKYTRTEYVATSGPVALPKIPPEDWWGKEGKYKNNKNWE